MSLSTPASLVEQGVTHREEGIRVFALRQVARHLTFVAPLREPRLALADPFDAAARVVLRMLRVEEAVLQ